MKLLIVDDEVHIRRMMRLTLEAAGYEVDEAATGEDGLARFGDGSHCAAVLLDQKMPGIDGLETLRQMKERAPEACVVMVTAFASIMAPLCTRVSMAVGVVPAPWKSPPILTYPPPVSPEASMKAPLMMPTLSASTAMLPPIPPVP